MLYWIYDISTVAAVGIFAAVFVGVCWLGTILSRPLVQSLVDHQPGLNEMVGDFLQYFGVTMACFLVCSPWPRIKTYRTLKRLSATKHLHWLPFIEM